MNNFLQLFLNKFVIMYINNILIFFHLRKKHINYIQSVIKCLNDTELYVKLLKCSFMQKKIDFCKHTVDEEKVQINYKKVKAIID